VQRPLSSLALFALMFLVSIPVSAQPWGARLVKVLDQAGRADLLTDASGKIPVSVTLPANTSAEALGLGPFGDGTASMRLTPAEAIAFGAAHPDMEMFVGPPLRPLLDKSRAWTGATVFRDETGFDGKGVAVGVIDTGIDILHPDFRGVGGGGGGAAYPELEDQYCVRQGTTCAIFSEAEINGFLKNNETGGTRDMSGHGTHVTSIAAGNGGPMVNAFPRYIGVAPGADLIIGAMDGFQDEDVAYAAKFIFERADSMGKPCVVNLSIGSDYGPHDGSSILERRLSRLVGDNKPGHAIVTAAGNSGGLYVVAGHEDEPWGIHTETRVYPNADMRVPIYAPVSKGGHGFLWITFQPGDEVAVGLEGPDGATWVQPVAPGHEGGFKNGPSSAGVVNNVFKPGSSLVPVTNGAVVVWSGEWKEGSEFAIHLSGNGNAQMWLTSTGDLADTVGLLFKRAIRQGTINVPASAPSLLAVGCTLNRLGWPTVNGPAKPVELSNFGGDDKPELDSVCYFSSAGPTPGGLPKPEISAPGGFVGGAMAKTADPRTAPGGLFDGAGCPDDVKNCFVVDEYHAIAAGTSMSSPHVAGAIALLFQSNPNLTQAQATAVLQAGARYPKGKVANPVQLGPGELDLLGALRALGSEEEQFASPDVAKSWYVLSSTYARPDTSWPVYGTVELRRADGEVAHALDGTSLTLEVKNGVTVLPLTKIRHGLYRFAVAGEAGKGGQSMTIDVRYEGRSIEKKTVAINNDVWTPHEALDAVGGCSVGSRGEDRVPVWMVGAAAATLALGARRRKRARA
jgi:subtilisin family serine protease